MTCPTPEYCAVNGCTANGCRDKYAPPPATRYAPAPAPTPSAAEFLAAFLYFAAVPVLGAVAGLVAWVIL